MNNQITPQKKIFNNLQEHDVTYNLILAVLLATAVFFGYLFLSTSSALQANADTTISMADNDSYGTYYYEQGESPRLAALLSPRDETSDDTTNEEEEEEGEDSEETETEQEMVTSDSEESQEEERVTQCDYLQEDLRIDFNNSHAEVLKLQYFLRVQEGYSYVPLSGEFEEDTLRAVEAFQTRYAEDILHPWGYESDESTGYVYITTRKKINELYCDDDITLSSSAEAEISAYRQQVNSWRSQGADFSEMEYLNEHYGRGQVASSEAAVETTPDSEGQQQMTEDATTTDTDSDMLMESTTTEDDTSTTTTEEDNRNFFERLFGIGGDEDEQATTSTTTDDSQEEATSSEDMTTTTTDNVEEQSEDNRNFFERLFGIGGDDTATTSDEEATSSQATTSDSDGDSDTTTTAATAERATGGVSLAASIDQMAAGVYSGVNNTISFLLSPTFLLILLAILVILLMATLLTDDETETDATPGGGDKQGETTSTDTASATA